MKNKALKIAFRFLWILFLAALAGTFFMTLAYRVPAVDEIRESTMNFWDLQGWQAEYPLIAKIRQNYFASFMPGVFEGGTMKIELDIIYTDSASSALKNAMVPSYFRYWNGYVSVLRPLFYFWDYEKVEVLNCFLQFFLIVYTAVLVGKKFSSCYLWVFLTSAVLIFYPVVAICFQYTWVCWIGYGTVAVYLNHTEHFEKTENLLELFLISGILTNYFDLLTYPLFTWGLPIIWVILYRKNVKWSENVKNVILTAISWITGYGGMWILKWSIASVVLHVNAFKDAIDETNVWAGGTADIMLYRWIALSRNWRHYQYVFYAMLLFVWLAVWIIMWQFNGWKRDSRVIALAVIACSSLVWCFVMYYHVYVHHFFTYRIDSVAVIALIGIGSVSVRGFRDKKPFSAGRLLRGGITLAGILCLAFAMESVSFEENEFFNWETPVFSGNRNELRQPVTIEFYPDRKYVTQFSFVLFRENMEETGQLIVKVTDDSGEQLYFEKADLSELDATICRLDVAWKFNIGQRYLIEIALADYTENIFYICSDDGSLPINGIKYMDENGRITDTQPAMGITYFGRAFSQNTKTFYLCTWIGVLCAVLCVILNVSGLKKEKEAGNTFKEH